MRITLGSLMRPSAVSTTAVPAAASFSCCSLYCGMIPPAGWPTTPAMRGARAVVEQRRHGHARELHHVGGHLARHGERQDGGVHGAAGLVVVLVAGRGDAEEGRRLAHREIDEALGDALDALGELVLAAAQVLEEAAHDDDRRRVGARHLDAGVDALGGEVLAQHRGGGERRGGGCWARAGRAGAAWACAARPRARRRRSRSRWPAPRGGCRSRRRRPWRGSGRARGRPRRRRGWRGGAGRPRTPSRARRGWRRCARCAGRTRRRAAPSPRPGGPWPGCRASAAWRA